MRTITNPLIRLDARGRRRISALGWSAMAVGAFAGLSIAAFVGQRLRGGSLRAAVLPAAQSAPAPLAPAPGEVTVSQRQVKAAERSAMEVWSYLAFPLGLASEERARAYIEGHTLAGPGRDKLLALIDGWRGSGRYWRRPSNAAHTVVDRLTAYSSDGLEVALAWYFPDGAMTVQQVSLETGEVLRAEALPGFVIRLVMRYDTRQGRWLWADHSVTAVSSELPGGVFSPEQ